MIYLDVRSENPIDSRRIRRLGDTIKLMKLFAEIRRTFQQPSLPGLRIDDCKTNDVSPVFGVVPCARSTAFDSQPEGIPRPVQYPTQQDRVHLLLWSLGKSLDGLLPVSLGSSHLCYTAR